MSIKLIKLSSIVAVVAIASSLMTGIAQAESIPETFKKAYFINTGDSFDNATILGQLKFITGIGGFAETKIANEGRLIDLIYQDVMEQQAKNEPRIITRDLMNHYDTSVAEYQKYSN